MPIQIIKQDITKMTVDVIVNSTDPVFSGSGGVDYQIHKAAGSFMRNYCAMLDFLAVGEVCKSPGFCLPCRYVIHTVGPRWQGGFSNEVSLLKSCYIKSLMLAVNLGAKSIAFPLISSCTFGFPKDKVMRIATSTISDYLNANECELDVYICLFECDTYSIGLAPEIRQYLENELKNIRYNEAYCDDSMGQSAPSFQQGQRIGMPFRGNPASDLEYWLKQQDDSFAITLLKLIDKKGMTDVACYKKANISRKTFSKINTDKNYRPSKQTVIAFAVALELDLNETEQLLKTAGFSLSHSNAFDLIIEFCIRRKIYDVMQINEILYQYDQVLLGC